MDKWRVDSVYSIPFTTGPIRRRLQVLTQVYPDPRNVDDELVESIRVPSLDPNAPEARIDMCSAVERRLCAQICPTVMTRNTLIV